MRTIIAATDLSTRSAQVLGRAVRIAKDLHADQGGTAGVRIFFVHVMEKAGFSPRRALRLKSRVNTRSGAMETLTALAAAFYQMPALRDAPHIECRVADGAPEAVLSALIAQEKADLLILGLHQERRVLDALRLSTMERILLRGDCPVLIAHRPPERRYATVLGAVDFGPASAQALILAGKLAPDAAFHAIHALQQPLRDKLSPTDTDDTAAMVQAEMLRQAFCETPGLPKNLHLPEIVPGPVHEVLNYRLDELRPDLLAIGTQSSKVADRLGHYARDLMRAPPTDVLIAKPGRAGAT